MTTPAPTVFATDRMIARPWQLADARSALELYGDPEVVRYIGGVAEPDLDAMRARLAGILERDRAGPPGMGSFPCFARDDGRQVGTAIIRPLPDVRGQLTQDIEIGWHLARREWGQGYATEMGRELLRYGFAELGLERLHALVEPPNLASLAVARRLGMREQGVTRRYYDGRELLHLLRAAGD